MWLIIKSSESTLFFVANSSFRALLHPLHVHSSVPFHHIASRNWDGDALYFAAAYLKGLSAISGLCAIVPITKDKNVPSSNKRIPSGKELQ